MFPQSSRSDISQPESVIRRGSVLSDKDKDSSVFENVALVSMLTLDEDSLIVKASPDKQFWAIGNERGAIKIYTTQDVPKLMYTLSIETENSPCTCLEFLPPDKNNGTPLLAATYASGYLRIWHYTGASNKSRLMTSVLEERYLSPDEENRQMNAQNSGAAQGGAAGKTAAAELRGAAAASTTRVGSGKANGGGGGSSGKPRLQRDEVNQITCCAVSFDGARLLTGGDDCVIRVYSLSTMTEERKCQSSHSPDKSDGHKLRIFALKYVPRGQFEAAYRHIFVSGGWDDSVQIWDDRMQHSLWQYYGPHICSSSALDIDAGRGYILTGSWRRDKSLIQVWNFADEIVANPNATLTTRMRTRYDEPQVRFVQDASTLPTMGYIAMFFGEQHILYGGSNHNLIRILDRSTMSILASINNMPNAPISCAIIAKEDADKKYRIAILAGNKLYTIKY